MGLVCVVGVWFLWCSPPTKGICTDHLREIVTHLLSPLTTHKLVLSNIILSNMPSLFSRLNIFTSNKSKKSNAKKKANNNDKQRRNTSDNDRVALRREDVNLVQRLTSGDSNVTLQTRNTT